MVACKIEDFRGAVHVLWGCGLMQKLQRRTKIFRGVAVSQSRGVILLAELLPLSVGDNRDVTVVRCRVAQHLL